MNLSASPYHVGKAEDREEMLVTRARDTSAYFAFCNLVGGQDELVFDGHSVVLDEAGEVVARAPGFEEHLLVVDVEPSTRSAAGCATCGAASSSGRASAAARRDDRARRPAEQPTSVAAIVPVRAASSSRCGSRSPSGSTTTSRRTGSATSWSAVSGGIDSAVTAALCADALGAERVHCVSMPSRFSSEGTRDDARPSRRASAATSARSRSRTPSVVARRARAEIGAVSPGSPPRTCRLASAASCSWRCRTPTAGWSSRRGTSRSSRSATRRSTGTWSAGSRC